LAELIIESDAPSTNRDDVLEHLRGRIRQKCELPALSDDWGAGDEPDPGTGHNG
jgi:hypothetical protein